jgi:hypothetical protein
MNIVITVKNKYITMDSLPTTINGLKSFIKNVGGKITHPKKLEYYNYIEKLYWYKTFPWREEQLNVFNAFIENEYKHIVIQGIFGVGKSQMLLGLLFTAIMENKFKCNEIIYTAFNVCVKNEIKKKLSNYGIKKITVSTFDSIVYKLCKYNDMPNYEEPNYEGRRKFLYNSPFDTPFDYIQLVILDECQDLEIQALHLFKKAFPNAVFIFAGDILQSIQKEPKESILWQIMMNHDDYNLQEYKKIFMYETPRVPINILNNIRTALTQFYPEFSSEFNKWKSKNTTTLGKITWRQFSTYKEIFSDALEFCQQHDQKDVMILTFSSSITVRGTLGDVSRVRNFLKYNGIQVNNNHKQMDNDCVFLSTANSSKGLERKHVFVILSFPLEKAFINFSSNLIMNLITVALSRAQETVTIYIPNIIEKMSPILKYYQCVPEPTIHFKPKIEKGKKEFINDDNYTFEHMIEKEYSVVEALRLNVLKYETLEYVKSFAKLVYKSKLTDLFDSTKFIPKMFRDEERVLAGLLVEHLITTELNNEWPFNPINIENLSVNPGYKHCLAKIKSLFNLYNSLKTQVYTSCNINQIFDILHIYSQLLLATSHRIFVSLSDNELVKLKSYWTTCLKQSVHVLKPTGEYSIKIQSNCKMQYMTGIIDVFINHTAPYKTSTFWEIKASTSYDWDKDALSQVMLYVLMNAKSRCNVVLINPFRNTVLKYAINIPNINTVRHKVMNDVLIYNANSFLAKNINNEKVDTLSISDTIFVNKICDENVLHSVVCKLFSPTKIEILYNQVGITDKWEEKSCEIYKLAKETFEYYSDVQKECDTICKKYSNIYTIDSRIETALLGIVIHIVKLSEQTKFIY